MADASEPLDLANILRPSGPWDYADAKEGYEYIVSVEGNKMSYADDAGNRHEIHIPTGRANEAGEHFANRRWDELAKFPKWDNQQYTDEDYVITEVKKNPATDEEARGVVIKAQGEPLVKTADGKCPYEASDTVSPPAYRFCVMVECFACELGNNIYSFDHKGCTGGALNSCRDGADAHCCIGAGGKNTCSAQWYRGGGPGGVLLARTGSNAAANGTEECGGYVEPNTNLFTDADGVQHNKYIPRGSYATVVDLYEAGNLDELAKFPHYTGRGYTDDDVIPQK
ncbi:uncharacterized protein B0T15DRAFT_494927 [Chaetomium strumarium]|uniref:Uncharacterized protein n=1 Tax=Chaetomium strumarium TaxID=1170767 RepID=A0AAJ0GQV0_9PEZI|nr:hypothetical protein B0T15DRAFT_494927 [Chaetomium strumarium]